MWWRRQGRRLEHLSMKFITKQIITYYNAVFHSEALLTQDRDLLVPSSASVPHLLLLFFSAPIFLLLHLVTQLFQEIQSRGKTQLNWQTCDLSNPQVLQKT